MQLGEHSTSGVERVPQVWLGRQDGRAGAGALQVRYFPWPQGVQRRILGTFQEPPQVKGAEDGRLCVCPQTEAIILIMRTLKLGVL